MKDPAKEAIKRVRETVGLLLMVSFGAGVAWQVLGPLVPVLVSLFIVITVLWLVLFRRQP